MRMISCFIAVCMALALLPGCVRADNKIPDKVKEALDKAESFDLYSLDPTRLKLDEVPKDAFHGRKVLGKTTVKDAETRKKLLAALEKGIAENKGEVAGCFNPRHGIRVTHDGKTYDLVICFECFSAEVYDGDKKDGSFLVTNSPQPAFNKVLTDAKVPLPKEATDK
jgi:hypothetical protein